MAPNPPQLKLDVRHAIAPSLEVLLLLMLSPRSFVSPAPLTSSEDSDINRDAGAGSRALTSKQEAN